MNVQRLPPLNALRAFEATARRRSMKDAADELCVTPGAVGQLIEALENDLGVAVFRRANRVGGSGCRSRPIAIAEREIDAERLVRLGG